MIRDVHLGIPTKQRTRCVVTRAPGRLPGISALVWPGSEAVHSVACGRTIVHPRLTEPIKRDSVIRSVVAVGTLGPPSCTVVAEVALYHSDICVTFLGDAHSTYVCAVPTTVRGVIEVRCDDAQATVDNLSTAGLQIVSITVPLRVGGIAGTVHGIEIRAVRINLKRNA